MTTTSRLLEPRGWLLVWLPIAAIATLHYATPVHAHGVHDVARRLFYLPIVMGGILGGVRGGVLAAAVTTVAYAPHAWLHRFGPDPQAGTEKLLEMGFYWVLGTVSGVLADRQARQLAAEEALRAQLDRASRLEALGQLTAGLAHEIRNPLHAMRGTAEILLDAVPGDAPERGVGRGLVAEIDRLSSVLKRFLDFAREAEPARTEVDLAEVVATVGELLRAQASKQGTTLQLDVTPVRVQADREQLVQVVLGIAINGLQALQTGGTVALRTASQPPSIVVDNDGPPIPGDLLERIFDPFVSTRDEGTGLGLATAWRLMEAHDGRIEVANTGDGVRFRVVLPGGAAAGAS